MTLRANIFTHRIDSDVVAVIDCFNQHHPTPTVTNDAEAVVAFLYEWRYLRPTDLLVYKDTRQLWDGMWHRDGKFFGFEPICAPDVEAAILAMRKRVLDGSPAAVL